MRQRLNSLKGCAQLENRTYTSGVVVAKQLVRDHQRAGSKQYLKTIESILKKQVHGVHAAWVTALVTETLWNY
jgi:hypothetical protein